MKDIGRLLKNVNCEYDRWVVETQLCKLRDTSDTLIGRACAMFQWRFENITKRDIKRDISAIFVTNGMS